MCPGAVAHPVGPELLMFMYGTVTRWTSDNFRFRSPVAGRGQKREQSGTVSEVTEAVSCARTRETGIALLGSRYPRKGDASSTSTVSVRESYSHAIICNPSRSFLIAASRMLVYPTGTTPPLLAFFLPSVTCSSSSGRS